MSHAQTTAAKSGWIGLLHKLHSIELGGGPRVAGADNTKIPAGQLIQILRLLLMLLENGLSLPKALASLAADRSSRRYQHVLHRLRLTIESGGQISEAMVKFPRTFTPMQIQQIRIGEKSGSLERTLFRVCEQLENKTALRKRVIKKITYPALITTAGLGLTIFMCTMVVPEFEKVYSASKVDLPPVTRVVTATSRFLLSWGLLAFPLLGVLAGLWVTGRSRPRINRRIDAVLLRLPIIGPWLRDAAVLQFVEATSSMIECGYTPVDAVGMSITCVRNAAIGETVEAVARSVRRGEKLSVELAKHNRIFPATLCQLVAVGEQSGEFAKALQGSSRHLRERLESRIDASVGLLEPALTIGLAILIGGIVLSIYTPMFHMFEVLE